MMSMLRAGRLGRTFGLGVKAGFGGRARGATSLAGQMGMGLGQFGRTPTGMGAMVGAGIGGVSGAMGPNDSMLGGAFKGGLLGAGLGRWGAGGGASLAADGMFIGAGIGAVRGLMSNEGTVTGSALGGALMGAGLGKGASLASNSMGNVIKGLR